MTWEELQEQINEMTGQQKKQQIAIEVNRHDEIYVAGGLIRIWNKDTDRLDLDVAKDKLAEDTPILTTGNPL